MEENVDIYNLFDHYNALYFHDELSCCVLKWSSDLPLNCTGACHYDSGGRCEIHLSEPLLKFLPTPELKNTLLHQMVHAFLWIKDKNEDNSDHGSSFQEIRNSINSSSVMDNQRPRDGYNIPLHHKFKKDVSIHVLKKEIKTYRFHHYMCDTCGDWIKKSRYPSARDCIDKVDSDEFCGNLLCHWHTHKSLCTGSHIIAEPPKYKEKKTSLKDLKCDKVVLCATRELAKIKSVVEAMSDEEMDSEAEQVIQEDDRFERKQCQTKETLEDYSVSVIYDVSDDSEEINCEKSQAIVARTQRSIVASQKPNGVGKHLCTRRRSYGNKKRKQDGKWKREVAIVGEYFSMYGEEEEDEDIIPLKDKRTERRKKLKSLLSSWKNVIVTSNGMGEEDDDDDEECAKSKPEETDQNGV